MSNLGEYERTVDEEVPIVYFDLETSGFHRSCNILQVAAKCGKFKFNTYVTPTEPIPFEATSIHGIWISEDGLMLHDKKIESASLRNAVSALLTFLKSVNRPCYIAAHNLNFDGPRLIDAITACNLHEEFQNQIIGFIDTLKLIKLKTSRKGKGACTLTGLAEWLNITSSDAHNAFQDVIILEKIMKNVGISYESLSSAATSYAEFKTKCDIDNYVKRMLPSLQTMENVTSLETRKKLIRAGITIEQLEDVYRGFGSEGVYNMLLVTQEDGKPILHKLCIKRIVEWLSKV